MFCMLCVLLSALGCKLQPANWIQSSNLWWRTDWNMETDRSSLSKGIWVVRSRRSYWCMLWVSVVQVQAIYCILGISSWLVMLGWNEFKKKKMHWPIYQYQTDWDRLVFQRFSINSLQNWTLTGGSHEKWVVTLGTLHPYKKSNFQAIIYNKK